MNISTFLWLDGRAETLAQYYTGLFTDAGISDSGIRDIQRDAQGGVTTVDFTLGGQQYTAYNGGSQFPFTPAFSLYVECDDQQQLDLLWAGLTDGGEEGPGGSLLDRYGVTWQLMPVKLRELLSGAEPDATDRVLNALHAMTKIDIQGLVDAHDKR
ncbi:VOC family protein [Streptomyces sp. XM4193]|uniref:VOC family protein n=1 Tax=Streptomyces sp. XM4193 TaxID=2929782 RepID=UPI001FFA1335|nr:VOC family protein [Streptomyces sp. XM4193]MCK1795997.1 VOC family protein [Streptomyces sp. XM4193]